MDKRLWCLLFTLTFEHTLHKISASPHTVAQSACERYLRNTPMASHALLAYLQQLQQPSSVTRSHVLLDMIDKLCAQELLLLHEISTIAQSAVVFPNKLSPSDKKLYHSIETRIATSLRSIETALHAIT